MKILVNLANVVEFIAPFGSCGPGLYAFEDLGRNVVVGSARADSFQKRGQVVHELFRSNLDQEVLASILDTGICKLDRS